MVETEVISSYIPNVPGKAITRLPCVTPNPRFRVAAALPPSPFFDAFVHCSLLIGNSPLLCQHNPLAFAVICRVFWHSAISHVVIYFLLTAALGYLFRTPWKLFNRSRFGCMQIAQSLARFGCMQTQSHEMRYDALLKFLHIPDRVIWTGLAWRIFRTLRARRLLHAGILRSCLDLYGRPG